MSVSAQGQSSGNGRAVVVKIRAGQGVAEKSKRRATKRGRPPGVASVLPASVVAELGEAVMGKSPPTPEDVKRLDERFQVQKRYGVTQLRLRNFLSKLSLPPNDAAATACTEDGVGEAAEWKDKVDAHRRRQASVASIIDEVFGEFARSSPDLWERRAYLLLVGHVYERLATAEEEISTNDLFRLARVLAENRKFEGHLEKTREGDESAESPVSPSGDLPNRFADIVRQVYGTNFQASAAEESLAPCDSQASIPQEQ